MVQELLLGGDHAVQELKGEEVDADVGGRVHQGPILPRKGHCSNRQRILYTQVFIVWWIYILYRKYAANSLLKSSVADPGYLSRIRILIFLPIPDPGSMGQDKKAPDPGSATLLKSKI
jgi:hypothetical protein